MNVAKSATTTWSQRSLPCTPQNSAKNQNGAAGQKGKRGCSARICAMARSRRSDMRRCLVAEHPEPLSRIRDEQKCQKLRGQPGYARGHPEALDATCQEQAQRKKRDQRNYGVAQRLGPSALGAARKRVVTVDQEIHERTGNRACRSHEAVVLRERKQNQLVDEPVRERCRPRRKRGLRYDGQLRRGRGFMRS